MTTEEKDDQRKPEKEMWTAGYKYSWRKMEAEAQNRAADGEEWSMAYVPRGATRLQ